MHTNICSWNANVEHLDILLDQLRVIACQVMQGWTWPISEFDKNLPSSSNMWDMIILKLSA